MVTSEKNVLYQFSEIELSYRNKIPPHERIRINDSRSAEMLLRNAWDENRIELVEEFKVVLLAHNNSCIGVAHIATGGAAFCPVDPKIVFALSLKANAAAIILAHNHPSGNLTPSDADLSLTGRLCKIAKLLDMEVIDHLILTQHDFTSFVDSGLMPLPH